VRNICDNLRGHSPPELRVYPGADADFVLYEDEGDAYDYEHGAYSVISIHCDEKAGKLAIGDRRGSFPGMLEHRTFHAVIVNDGHGTGIAANPQPDVTIEYEGKATSASAQVGSRP
jgi:alpha-D-xyloside xylohydrolase